MPVKLLSLLVFISSFTVNAQNIDINLLKDINLHRDKSLDKTFQFISDSDTPIAVATPVLIYAIGAIYKDNNLKKQAIFIGETLIVSVFVTTAMKYSFQRSRPYVDYPEIDKQSYGGSYSFPSGHTSIAFAAATSLSIAFPKWYIIAPSFIWATTVGYSRLDLGVHYPTDVLAGALVGSGSAYLTYQLNKWINKKHSHTIN